MPDIVLLAIDWGTTSARAYALDRRGDIVETRSASLGVQTIAGRAFGDALARLCGGLPGGLPMLACGMIGSRQGWVETPYCPCPAGIDRVAASIVRVPGTGLGIVPGLSCRDDDGIDDLMRGEETQILGALGGAAAAREVVVLPGTHSKWALVGEAGIESFATFMTGEIYALLLEHGILGRLAQPGEDAAALERGVRHALRNDAALTHDLFGARTLALAGALAPSAVGDYLSGLLLGAEVAAAQRWMSRRRCEADAVTLVGAPALTGRYRRALALAGIEATIGPDDAAARGLWGIARHAEWLQ